MNKIRNHKHPYLSAALCLFIAKVTVAPLAGQETASDTEAPEMTEQTEKAIDRGLKFLISSQNKDGSWSSGDAADRGGDTRLLERASDSWHSWSKAIFLALVLTAKH